MERVAGTHHDSYGLAILSPLSVNFAGGARRAGRYRARRPKSACLEGGGVPALCWRLLALPESPWGA